MVQHQHLQTLICPFLDKPILGIKLLVCGPGLQGRRKLYIPGSEMVSLLELTS